MKMRGKSTSSVVAFSAARHISPIKITNWYSTVTRVATTNPNPPHSQPFAAESMTSRDIQNCGSLVGSA